MLPSSPNTTEHKEIDRFRHQQLESRVGCFHAFGGFWCMTESTENAFWNFNGFTVQDAINGPKNRHAGIERSLLLESHELEQTVDFFRSLSFFSIRNFSVPLL